MSTQQIIESWENGVEPYNATTHCERCGKEMQSSLPHCATCHRELWTESQSERYEKYGYVSGCGMAVDYTGASDKPTTLVWDNRKEFPTY